MRVHHHAHATASRRVHRLHSHTHTASAYCGKMQPGAVATLLQDKAVRGSRLAESCKLEWLCCKFHFTARRFSPLELRRYAGVQQAVRGTEKWIPIVHGMIHSHAQDPPHQRGTAPSLMLLAPVPWHGVRSVCSYHPTADPQQEQKCSACQCFMRT